MNPTNETPLPRDPTPETESSTDARLLRELEEYCSDATAGNIADREAFLRQHADIADELASCLEGLDFIRNVAPQLATDEPVAAPDVAPQVLSFAALWVTFV